MPEVFLESTAASVSSAFSTALAGIQSDVMELVVIALPVGLAILAAFMAPKMGIKFFKSISK